MRVYTDFRQALNEIARDLNELGTEVLAGYQSKDMSKLSQSDLVKLRTKELIDYDYIVVNPQFEHLEPVQPWADQEWGDRLAGISGHPMNPGTSWESRKELWEPLLEQRADDPNRAHNLEFSYTYSERLFLADIPAAIRALEANLYSRQIWIPIWNEIDNSRLGQRRVPCSLGYQLTVRHDQLNIAYHMRSSDFQTHFHNDVWLALQLQEYFCKALGLPRGTFTHKLGSLHVYAADVAHVF